MYQPPRKRKRGFFGILTLFIVALAVGLGVGYAGAKLSTLPNKIEAAPKSMSISESTPKPQSTATPSSEPLAPVSFSTTVPFAPEMPAKSGYLVKTTDGKVCVFTIDEEGNTKYSQTLHVSLGRLPESDRKRLEEGIYLANRTELAELTEDYSS